MGIAALHPSYTSIIVPRSKGLRRSHGFRDRVGYCIPEYLQIDLEVAVRNAVPHLSRELQIETGNIPVQFRIEIIEFAGGLADRFDALQAASWIKMLPKNAWRSTPER